MAKTMLPAHISAHAGGPADARWAQQQRAEQRRRELAAAGMTIAHGSLDNHQAVTARRKRERQNRRRK